MNGYGSGKCKGFSNYQKALDYAKSFLGKEPKNCMWSEIYITDRNNPITSSNDWKSFFKVVWILPKFGISGGKDPSCEHSWYQTNNGLWYCHNCPATYRRGCAHYPISLGGMCSMCTEELMEENEPFDKFLDENAW